MPLLSGLVVGSATGGIVSRCWPAALSLGGGCCCFCCSFVLLGRRGAWLGAVGGVATGGAIAGMVDPTAFAITRKSRGWRTVWQLQGVFSLCAVGRIKRREGVAAISASCVFLPSGVCHGPSARHRDWLLSDFPRVEDEQPLHTTRLAEVRRLQCAARLFLFLVLLPPLAPRG